MKKGLKQREGSALLITLLIITTLTGLTMAFSEESSVELDLAGFSRDAHRAHEMARSGVNLALALLRVRLRFRRRRRKHRWTKH